MAVNINSVYQKVLTLLNKEQRGYLTPQEFNLLADRAQNEIYENYFHQIRNRPIFTRITSTTVRITPSPTNGVTCVVSYYKAPTAPSWGYVVVNEKALYNTNASVNFELAESEEEPLVSKILMLSGVVTKQQDIGQVGANAIQMTNQEQNS